ncbi:MAG: hypothetical protein ACRDFA_10925 [bacterium]
MGDVLMSPLGDFRRGIAPTQIRIGNVLEQHAIAGPVDTGSSLAFFIDTLCNIIVEGEPIEIDVIGVMYLSYDFSTILEFRLIEGGTFGNVVTQLDVIGATVRATFLVDFMLEVPAAGDFIKVMVDGFVTASAIYKVGTLYCVVYPAYLSNVAAVGVYDSDGVYIDVEQYHNVTAGDVVFNNFPFFDSSYVLNGFSKGTSRGVIRVQATDPTAASAVTFTAPGTISASPVLLGGHSSIVAALINRGADSSIFCGINIADLTFAWAKSTKKQESTVTVLVADTASTYRITIGAQNESVVGNVAGVDATAIDLKNQCAASAQSEFIKRTFTVVGSVVTVRANDAGILYTFSGSVTGGTGQISTINDQHLLPVTISSACTRRADATGRIAIPCGSYGVLIVDVDNGDVVSVAETENPPTDNPPSTGAALVGSATYLCGMSNYPEAFGPEPDADWQVCRFDAPPNNRTMLLDDVTLTPSAFTIIAVETPSLTDLIIESIPVAPPLDTFQTLETGYVY